MAISVDESWGATALALVGAILLYADTGQPAALLAPILLAAIFVWRSDRKS